MKLKRLKRTLICSAVVLFLTAAMLFGATGATVKGQAAENTDSVQENILPAQYGDIWNQIEKAQSQQTALQSGVVEPKWLTELYTIMYSPFDNYGNPSLEKKDKAYFSSGTVGYSYVNHEIFPVYAKDATGESIRLKPSNYINNPNLNANGQGKITVDTSNYKSYLGAQMSLNNDSLKVRQIAEPLGIAGDNDVVGPGLVFYRWKPINQASFSNATHYADLFDNLGFDFYRNETLQIAIIYELKESGTNIFQLARYYRLVAVYTVDAY